MKQFAEKMLAFGINPTLIEAGKRNFPKAEAYVAMAETWHKRQQKNPDLVKDLGIGLFIMDEAHHGYGFKILDANPDVKTIGLTATPISSAANTPLNKYYDDIVVST